MSLRVFDWNSNPAIDPHDYRLSNKRAEYLVAEGSHKKIKLLDGRTAIQKLPPPEERTSHAGYEDAWKIRPSAGIPVWQMVTA